MTVLPVTVEFAVPTSSMALFSLIPGVGASPLPVTVESEIVISEASWTKIP